jgi:hypothetical protein
MSAKDEICGRIFFLASFGFLFGLMWWSYDLVVSLRHGSWIALHFGDVLIKMGLRNFVAWAYRSHDWIGLSRMLKYILELSSCFVIMAMSALVYIIGLIVTYCEERV